MSEVITRLKVEAMRYADVVKRNDTLLIADEKLTVIRETMTDDNVQKLLTEQAKLDPGLDKWLKSVGGKISKVQSSELSTHDLDTLDIEADEKASVIMQLHSDTEMIYHNLWAAKTRLNQFTKFKNFNPSGVRDVRNHLIEHTDKAKSYAYIYSFGIATKGPVLRPVKPAESKAPHDRGLQTNVEEFTKALENVLSG